MNFKLLFSDLFDFKIIKYALIPLFIDLVFWGVVFYFFSDNITAFLHGYISMLPFGASINGIISNIGSTVLLVFLFYEAVILSLGVFTSLFIEKITLRINKKHYSLNTRKVSLLEGIWVSLKALGIFVLFFVFTFYLLFVPVVNIFYQVFLWSVAVKKPLVFDSVSLFCDYKEFERQNSVKVWVIVFISSFIYFVPVLSFFGYLFQLVLMTHFALQKCSKYAN